MKQEIWIIEDKKGHLAVNRIYDSEEDARFEFIAHPQYFNAGGYDPDDYNFIKFIRD